MRSKYQHVVSYVETHRIKPTHFCDISPLSNNEMYVHVWNLLTQNSNCFRSTNSNRLFQVQWLKRAITVIAVVCQPRSGTEASPEMASYPRLTRRTTETRPYTAPVYKSPCWLGLSCYLGTSITLQVSASLPAFDWLTDCWLVDCLALYCIKYAKWLLY